eukprot:COSAG01_NODE_596_length_15055_cov_17.624967_14_plen_595_part_00
MIPNGGVWRRCCQASHAVREAVYVWFGAAGGALLVLTLRYCHDAPTVVPVNVMGLMSLSCTSITAAEGRAMLWSKRRGPCAWAGVAAIAWGCALANVVVPPMLSPPSSSCSGGPVDWVSIGACACALWLAVLGITVLWFVPLTNANQEKCAGPEACMSRGCVVLLLAWLLFAGISLLVALGHTPSKILTTPSRQTMMPAALQKLGRWSIEQRDQRDVHGTKIVPDATLTLDSLPLNLGWQALTFDTETGATIVHAANDASLRGSREGQRLQLLYCADAVVKYWTDTIVCNEPLVKAAASMRKFVPGIAALGWFTAVTMFQHNLLDGFPQLEAAFAFADHVLPLVGEPLQILCGPSILCSGAAARFKSMPTTTELSPHLLKGFGIGDRVGHHVEHLVVPYAYNNAHSIKQWSYPAGWYDIADEVLLSKPDFLHTSKQTWAQDGDRNCYVLFVSREGHTRSLGGAIRNKIKSALQRFLTPPSGCNRMELKIFHRPQDPMRDALIFRGAKAVLGVHGGALSNVVYCQPGTVVIEVLPKLNPRLFFAAVAYSRNLTHYTYNPSHWVSASYYTNDIVAVNSSRFIAFTIGVLRAHGWAK